MKARHFEIVVVGSGFGGSLISMAARRLGFSVALLERGRHPRFVIGESTTPITNLLLEEIADEFDLPGVRSFSKWGTWQEKHPDIGCGLKRGFTFYKHDLGQPFPSEPGAALARQLLVGASPNERVSDTHWYRPQFDHAFVQQAEVLGVVYEDEVAIDGVVEGDPVRLSGTRGGERFEISADFLIDASGPRGFLHRAFRLPEKSVQGFPHTQALFTHFERVAPLPPAFTPGTPPYPPEDAAVHHLFEGGWIWVLKFNNGITSAGAVAVDSVAERLQFRSGEAGWRNLLRELPSLNEVFGNARASMPFTWQPRTAFQSGVVVGERWALLPSAAGVIDPLLSTGFPLTLLGVQRLARLLKVFGRPAFAPGLRDYAEATTREFEFTARLVKGLYARMVRFERFKELSLFYFVAASFSEAARRLGKTALAPDYLLCRHPEFGQRLRALCGNEGDDDDDDLAGPVCEALERFDVAGFTDKSRDPWYPASPKDLFGNASKLGVSEADITAMLTRCGMSLVPTEASCPRA